MILALLLALNLTRVESAPIPACISPEGFFIPCSDSVPLEKIADPFVKDLAWIATGTALDLGSTSASLRFCPSCRESNPLGWDSEARISLKLASGVAAGTGCYYLRRSGHGRTATIIRWVAFGIQAAAATNNFRHAILGR